jgi:hypothetical protein
MNVTEKVCPVCKTVNKPEASLCRKCGAKLDDPPVSQTRTTEVGSLPPELLKDWSITDAKAPTSGIDFHIEGRFNPAHIDPKGEFVLGRKTGKTSEILLDLAPFRGYALGVSRRHAVVRQAGEGYEVIDLGSVNGSWLNEERLTPHSPQPLPSGSHLRLGRMRLFVLYKPFGETE